VNISSFGFFGPSQLDGALGADVLGDIERRSASPAVGFDGLAAAPLDEAPAFESGFQSIVESLAAQMKKLERTFASAMRGVARGLEIVARAVPSGSSPTSAKVAACPSKYGSIIRDAAARHQLDPNLLCAVIDQESSFNSRAVSKAGAMGLMQLMPDTAKSLGVSDPFDPQQNVEGGAALLRELIDHFGGKLDLALAAYNAGSGAVEKYGGIPPYPETRAYVRDILASYRAAALS